MASNADDDFDLLDQDQLAALLRTNRNNLAQMRFRGTGPKYVKIGRRILLPAIRR